MTDDVTEPAAILDEALDTLAAENSTAAERGSAAESVLLVAERAPETLLARSDDVAAVIERNGSDPDSAPTARQTNDERTRTLVELERDLGGAARAVAEAGGSVPETVEIVTAALAADDSRAVTTALEAVDLLFDRAGESGDGESSVPTDDRAAARETAEERAGSPGTAEERAGSPGTAEERAASTETADEVTGDDPDPVVDTEGARAIAERIASLLRSDDGDVVTAAGERMALVAELFPGVAVDHVDAVGAAVDPTVGPTGDGNSVLALRRIADVDPAAVANHTDAVVAFMRASRNHAGSFATENVQQGLFVCKKIAEHDPGTLVSHVGLVVELLREFEAFLVQLHGIGTLEHLARHHPRVVSEHAESIVEIIATADTGMHADRMVVIASSLAKHDPTAFAPHIGTLFEVSGRFDDQEDLTYSEEQATEAAVIDDGIANVVAQVSQTTPRALEEHLPALEGLLDRVVTVHDTGSETTVHIAANTLAALATAGEYAPRALTDALPTAERAANAIDHENVTVNLIASYRTVTEADPGAVADRVDRFVTALERTTHERGRKTGLAALSDVAAVRPDSVAPHIDTVLEVAEEATSSEPVMAGLLIVHYLAEDSPEALVDVLDRVLSLSRSVDDPQAVGGAVEAIEGVSERHPDAVAPLLGPLLELLDGPVARDLAVVEQTLFVVRSVGQEHRDALEPHLGVLDTLFDRFDDQYIQSKLATLYGIVARERPDDIAERLPQLVSTLERFEDRGPRVNGAAAIGELSAERPEAVLEHWDRIEAAWPTDKPVGLGNLAEVLAALAPADETVATSRLDLVIPGLQADDDRVPKAILTALAGIASIAPDAVLAHTDAVVDCLQETDSPDIATAALKTLNSVAEARPTPLMTHGDAIAATLDRFDEPAVATAAFSCLTTIATGTVSGWIEDHTGAIVRALHRIDDPGARTAGLLALRYPARDGHEQVVDRARILGRIVADATDPDLLVAGTGVLYEIARAEPSTVTSYAQEVGAAMRDTAEPATTLWDACGPKLPGSGTGKEFLVGVLNGFVGVDRDRTAVAGMTADETAVVNRVLAWVMDGSESAATGGAAMDVLAVTGSTLPDESETEPPESVGS